MRRQCRSFPFLAALSAAVATLAFGQASPGAGSGEATASVPDLSGMWVHPYFPGIEPPASGPGPVFNRTRLVPGGQLVGDFTNPILKPQAAAIVKKRGDRSGMTYPTPSNRCWPSGVPYIFFQPGLQMLQQPHQIVLLYLRDHEFRRVRLNARHPVQVTPSWFGDSVGHYEGDTLVIDTVGIKVGPFAMVDWYGTPYTEALHVIERYRLIDDETAKEAEKRSARENVRLQGADFAFSANPNDKSKGLQLQFTVDDEGIFTMPWSATVTYRRPSTPLVARWPEYACAENILWYSGKDAAVPTAVKADF